MYYYDTGECILNDKNRATSAAAITDDTMNMRVDYFENRCFDGLFFLTLSFRKITLNNEILYLSSSYGNFFFGKFD